MEDPYKTLGVARDASQDDIRRAYRNLAKRHHPDLNPGNIKAEERFKTVSAANEILSDVEKRGQFDRGEIDGAGQAQAPRSSYRDYAETEPGRRYGHAGPQSDQWTATDFEDMFGSMFHKGERAGQDEHFTLSTGFLDAVNGATQRLTLPDGRVLDVKIPQGTQSGQTLRLRGQGGRGAAGKANGDALIAIQVAPHGYFRRDGQTIRLELPVTLPEAVLGGLIQVPTPGGPVRMRIPPHSDSGTELRLRGRGVPGHGGLAAGDLYATLRVVLGSPDAALEEFLAHWAPEHPVDPRRAMEMAP